MTDVRLDRPQPQRAAVRALPAVRGEQRLRLDLVTERGARTVRLDRVDLGGGQSGVGQRLPDHPLLCGAVRGGQAVAGAVLVDGGAAQQGEDRVTVAAGVGEALDQEHADAFGPGGAVVVIDEAVEARGPDVVRGRAPDRIEVVLAERLLRSARRGLVDHAAVLGDDRLYSFADQGWPL